MNEDCILNVVTGWNRRIFYTLNVLLYKMLLDDLKQYVLYLAIIIISINLAVENQMITPKNRVRSVRFFHFKGASSTSCMLGIPNMLHGLFVVFS